MSKSLFIFGAGGFAKEIYWLIREINSTAPTYEVKGFIDQQAHQDGLTIGREVLPIVAEHDSELQSGQYCFALGIGNPLVGASVTARFAQFDWPNLIHPSFLFHRETIKFGLGNVVTAGCVFTVDIQVGSFNIFNLHTTVGHDVKIGSNNVLNPGVHISGGVVIGDQNLFGTNCSVLQGLEIENRCVVGANALVTKNVTENSVVVGVPAKPLVK